MKRIAAIALMLAVASAGLSDADAQHPSDTAPTSSEQHVVLGWDRAASPGDIELWPRKTLLAYEEAGTLGHGGAFLTCRSSTDAGTGRCPTTDTQDSASGLGSVIPIRFTEQRSGVQVELEVEGELRRADSHGTCGADRWSPVVQPLWTSVRFPCTGAVGTGAGLWLRADQLQRLVAGRWTATLALELGSPSQLHLASYRFTFDLTVTDRDAAGVYFPAFDSVTPQVGLNLRYDPGGQRIAGHTELDMCLYDGLGSHSAYVGVTVRDSEGDTSRGDLFSVWHRDGERDESRRVDYAVSLTHGGARNRLRNGEELLLTGLDSVQLRRVNLPGSIDPVFCVPTPLTLETPSFSASSKRAGYYSGGLKVEMRLPTSTP